MMTQHLTRKVDEGESFNTAGELFNIMKKFPLRFTEYHLLDLKRDKVNWSGSLPDEVEKESFGREYYLIKNMEGDGKNIVGYCYSNRSEGKHLPYLDPESKWTWTTLPKFFLTITNMSTIFHPMPS